MKNLKIKKLAKQINVDLKQATTKALSLFLKDKEEEERKDCYCVYKGGCCWKIKTLKQFNEALKLNGYHFIKKGVSDIEENLLSGMSFVYRDSFNNKISIHYNIYENKVIQLYFILDTNYLKTKSN